MALPLWTILVATFGLVVYLRRLSDKKSSLKPLPGPKRWPIVGNLFDLGTFPNKQFTKWSKVYGDLFQFKLGTTTTIVVSDPKMAKELFSDPALTGRRQSPHVDFYEDTPALGVFSSEGNLWEVHRRFLLRQLRDFGFGKSSMEALITDELSEIINLFKKREGKPIGQIRETLRLAVVNSLWSIVSSERFDIGDPKLLKLSDYTSTIINEVIDNGSLILFLPWLRHIIPIRSGYTAYRNVIQENVEFFENAIAHHKKNFLEGEPKDYIDLYLGEMKKAENDPSSPFYGKIAERNLAATLFDLFIAGNDTTAMTTSWAILYLCKWPHVQQQLQKEIEEITGNSRRVSVNDRPNMPYAVALIDEVLRYSSIVPNGGQHRAIRDKQYRGYHIPKDAIVQANLYQIHFNHKLFPEPEAFRPERFIEDGKYKKNENLMPFQVGKRQCLGETLARDTVFLYVTNLFQQFTMKFNPDEAEPSGEPDPGFFLNPPAYSVIMTDRLDNN